MHKNKASITLVDSHNTNFEKYHKSPYDPNKLLTTEITRYYTHTFINILEIYCKNFNINFKYSIYEHDYNYDFFDDDMNYLGSLKDYMLNYSNNYFAIDYPIPTLLISNEELSFKCHSEYADNKYFYRANDYIPNKISGHWGLHRNLHVAETINKLLV